MELGQTQSTLGPLIILLICGSPTFASVGAAALCDAAAATAAAKSNVPLDVLRALTRTETGRATDGTFQPWPWAINQGGQGHWFDTREEMMGHIDGLLAAGVSNFDVGCFQLNYRWHAPGFSSLQDMADPDQNAAYAAEYLAEKFAASGDWGQAAAAYHSATPALAARYLARFDEIYAALGPATIAAQAFLEQPDRPNLFPLLIAGQSGAGGSLVPMTARGRRLFGGDQ